jgi:gentisate 1,2-dioxygenase
MSLPFKLEDFHGKHPYPPNEKKPTLITRDKIVTFAYGNKPHLDFNWLFISTDKLHVGIYQIPPGGRFEPPDVHAGDELYYILKGTLTMFNPETGDVHKVSKGEVLLIPKDGWHQGHNFTDEVVTILFSIAPLMWDPKKGPPPEFPGKPKLYKVP